MLRGSSPATVDAKGRVKIPSQYRAYLENEFGTAFYVTSVDGAVARIYPLTIWEENEKKLNGLSSLSTAIDNFYTMTGFYGKEVEMDSQGRILLPATLRKDANINGEVMVLGKLHFLEVVNMADVRSKVEKSKLSKDDMHELSTHGIK